MWCHVVWCLRRIYPIHLQEYNVKMDAAHSSETLVTIYQSTWRHISEDSTLHNHCHENLISPIKSSSVTLQTRKDVLLSHQSCEAGVCIQCFEDCLCLAGDEWHGRTLYSRPQSMLTAVPAQTTGAGHHERLTPPNVHSAVFTETANSILCVYNKTFITSAFDDGDRVSETLGANYIFKQLIACEDFTAGNCCESFKSCTTS
jgi:hypothetical protein